MMIVAVGGGCDVDVTFGGGCVDYSDRCLSLTSLLNKSQNLLPIKVCPFLLKDYGLLSTMSRFFRYVVQSV